MLSIFLHYLRKVENDLSAEATLTGKQEIMKSNSPIVGYTTSLHDSALVITSV